MEKADICLDKYNLPFETQNAVLLYGGSRSQAYLTGEIIIRIPTQDKFLVEQKREADISQIIQNNIFPKFKDKIPSIVFTGQCSYHKQIKGNLLNKVFHTLTINEKKCLAKDIAELLFAIHSIPTDKFDTINKEYNKTCRNENKTISADFDYEIAKRHILDCSNNTLNLDNFKTDIPTNNLVLCHNDLHTENIIVNENNKLSGFIDFGEAGINPSITDFFHLYRIEGKFSRNIINEYNKISNNSISLSAADYQFLSNTGYHLEKRKERSSFVLEVQKVLKNFL